MPDASIIDFKDVSEKNRPKFNPVKNMEDFKSRKLFCVTGTTDSTVKTPMHNGKPLSVKNNKKWLDFDSAEEKRTTLLEKLKTENTHYLTPLIGIRFINTNGIIGLDVDVKPALTTGGKGRATETIPKTIIDLLKELPTLVFWSRSGNGLHIIYSYTKETYDYLEKLGVGSIQTSVNDNDPFTGDVRINNGFLACTFKEHPLSSGCVKCITMNELKKLVPPLFKRNDHITRKNLESLKIETLQDDMMRFLQNSELREVSRTDATEFKEILHSLPSTYTEETKKLLTHGKFNKPFDVGSSDYWRTILFGVAYIHIAAEIFENTKLAETVEIEFQKWCENDQGIGEKGPLYQGVDDVKEKFDYAVKSTQQKLISNSKGNVVNIVKYSTLIYLSKLLNDYPDKRKNVIIPASIANIQHMLLKNNLEVRYDQILKLYCLKGKNEFIEKNFNLIPDDDYTLYREKGYTKLLTDKEFALQLLVFLQKEYSQSSITTKAIADPVNYLITNATKQNIFTQCIESVPYKGKEQLDDFVKLIDFDTDSDEIEQFWQSAFKRFLIAVVAMHRNIRLVPDNNGILKPYDDEPTIPYSIIFCGPERTNKSYFCRNILPNELKKLVQSFEARDYEGQSNQKDKRRFLGNNILTIFDEIDVIFKSAYNEFKGFIDQRYMKFRDVYKTKEEDMLAISGILGTSNNDQLFAGDNGARKIILTKVKYFDSYAQDKIDKQQLLAEIDNEIKKFRRENPDRKIQEMYQLTDEEINLNNRINASHKLNFQPLRPLPDYFIFDAMKEIFETFATKRSEKENRKFFRELYCTKGRLTIQPDDLAETHVNDLKKLHKRAADKTKNPLLWDRTTFTAYLTFINQFLRYPAFSFLKPNDALKALKRGSEFFTQSDTKSVEINKNFIIQKGGLIVYRKKQYYILPHVDIENFKAISNSVTKDLA